MCLSRQVFNYLDIGDFFNPGNVAIAPTNQVGNITEEVY